MPSDTDEQLPTSIAIALGVADAAALGVAAYLVFESAPLAVALGALSGAGGYFLLSGLIGDDTTDDADDRGVAGTGLDPTALGIALSNAAVGGFAAALVVGVESLVVAGIVGAGVPGYGLGLLFSRANDGEESGVAAD